MASDNAIALAEIRKYLNQVSVPDQWSKVYKDECVLSFDTPESEGGLYINLSTFKAYGRDFVAIDHKNTGNHLYLYQKWTKVIDEEPEEKREDQPTKLAIGVEGGFQVGEPKFHYDKEYAIVVLPSMLAISFPNQEIPEIITLAANAIIARDDASKMEAVSQWEEKRPVSKYAANLPQIEATHKISPNPKDWRCEESGMTENLWLNLSTGHIGSGRKNWDGSGGTGAALNHYNQTGKKYPLVVKLGTITPSGADVYSYASDEEDMVEDPKLAEHLAHWGINMMRMEKTEKTMAELDIELNLNYEFDKITEAGIEKQPLSGPGFIGLRNLGNSCYCNSLYQVLFSLENFIDEYLRKDVPFHPDAPADLDTQLIKLANGLLTSRYEDQGYISPQMIKTLLGQGHPEFSTNRQQDVHEYYQHLLTRIERNSRNADITKQFKFQMETRIECDASQRVRYTTHEENTLSLTIPVELATNRDRVAEYERLVASGNKPEEPVLLEIPFESVLAKAIAPEKIEGFYSSATKSTGTATKTVRFKSFPNYLCIHLRRYILAEDWTPKKLDALVPMPDHLDLESLRSSGLQPNEIELPESDGSASPSKPVPNEQIVSELSQMGFSHNACCRAALGVNNASYDAAANWLMEHMEDPDINDPLPDASGGSSSAAEIDPNLLQILLDMGIDPAHAARGLRETNGDVERAVDWCFNHDPMDISGERPEQKQLLPDGRGQYELVGIISHIGGNTSSGHYVCHIKKNGTWSIFNDRKVAVSSNPPAAMGYLYFYKRI